MVTFSEFSRSVLRLVRFSIVGSFNSVVSYLVFALFIRSGFHYTVATFAAFLVGMLMGFKLHGALVFDHSGERRFLRFALISVGLFGCSIGIQALARNTVNDYAAGAIAAAITIPISFLLNRTFVFHAADIAEREG